MPILPSRWTVRDAITVARTLVKARSQKEIPFRDIELAYRAAILDVGAELSLSKDPAYIVSESITPVVSTFGNYYFDIAKPPLTYDCELVLGIHDAVNGQCIERGLQEFMSIISSGSIDHESYSDSIIWTLTGKRIYIRYGKNLTPVTTGKTLFYQRSQLFPSSYESITEFVDLSDSVVPLFIKRMASYLIGEAVSLSALSQETKLDVSMAKDRAMSELSNRNKFASQTTQKES